MLINSLQNSGYPYSLGNTGASAFPSTQATELGPGLDQTRLSGEAGVLDGALNPALLQMLFETRLQSDLQLLEQARASGQNEPVEQAMQSLGGTYSQAKEQGVPLSPEIESAVRQALGLNEGGNAAPDGGGASGGNSTPVDGENGHANGGGAPVDGGGRSFNGGGVPIGGGGHNSGGMRRTGGGGGGDGSPPPTPSPDDRRFLDQAVSQDSKSFGDLVSAWKQGAEGNCSTVATIKAAMDRYDNKVFDQVNRTDNGYNIVMQDGYKMSLSDSELAAAGRASRFKGADGPAKSYANFLYGAAAKRNALQNRMSLQQSFNDLNNGESVHNPPKLLGLQHQVVKVDPRTLNGQDSVVAASSRHAIFIDRNANGSHTVDRWGRGVRFNGTDGANRRLSTAFTFKPRRTGTA